MQNYKSYIKNLYVFKKDESKCKWDPFKWLPSNLKDTILTSAVQYSKPAILNRDSPKP